MALLAKLRFWGKAPRPEHLERGALGENAARDCLKRKGFKFLCANFASRCGEIDLVFRDGDCLVFVEVKTRSSEAWARPSSAVDARKKTALGRAAADYLRLLKNPQVRYRFDIAEVLLENGTVREVRHIQNAFVAQNLHSNRQPR